MTHEILDNLVKIGQLKAEDPTGDEVAGRVAKLTKGNND